jgi:acyl-CoA synthetase (AMP-forming)/AMP-acid ligase II/acyl carrier protein
MSGAALVLRTDAMLDSGSSFLQRCAERGVTVLDLPTAYWHELVERMVAEKLPLPEGLRLVIIGGERAVPERWVQWRKTVGDSVRLLNTYGPTEATVVATMADLSAWAHPDGLMREVPIGRPISNVTTYLLDRHLNSVPIGVPGELYIGGDGLARGYLNGSELTAEKFLPDPFSKEPGARLYKTGDLARYLPDGNIQFLGRLDHQVKIRGFRIELGEIETILSRHPAIRETVVVAREEVENPKSETCTQQSRSIQNPKSLAAYVVTNPEQAPTVSELRAFLKQKLPEYMVPSAFVFLDALPLTANGKIDRKALPLPDQRRLELQEVYVAPRTPTEEMIAEIWAEVLKLDKVGIHDNFFELGGHSLLATQVISRLRDAFQLELPVRVLFERPTIEELALTVEEAIIEEMESQT